MFVTFEINFGSDSLEALHLVISTFARAQMFYPFIDTNNWSGSVPRMVHAWKHLQFKYFDTDYNLTPLQAFSIFVIQFFDLKAIVMICCSPKSAQRCHYETWQRWNFCYMEGSPGPQRNYHWVLGELHCKNPFNIKPFKNLFRRTNGLEACKFTFQSWLKTIL